MAKISVRKTKRHVALILVEGDTEVEFYSRIAEEKFHGISKQTKNLNGNFNINNKILDFVKGFSVDHPTWTFDVYVCVDQEKEGEPPYNRELVESRLNEYEGFRRLHDTIANLMIESLFFIDIDGLYAFIRAKRSDRNPKKYQNFRTLRHQDLSRLFKSFKNIYHKGHKCEGLVKSLNLEKIINEADEIREFIAQVIARKNSK